MDAGGDRPVHFIRFNPDAYVNHSGSRIRGCWGKNAEGLPIVPTAQRVQWEERLSALRTAVADAMATVPGQEVSVTHLFFDKNCPKMLGAAHETTNRARLRTNIEFIRDMKRALLGDGRADARPLNEQDVIPYEKMLEFATWCSTHRDKGQYFEKLRNAQLEKSGRLAANEEDLARWKLAHAAEALAPKVTFIRNMKRALLGDGRADARLLNEEDVIPYEKMLEFAAWCSTHRDEGHQLFGLRDKAEVNGVTNQSAVNFYNKVVKVWGFSKLQKNKKRKTKVIDGKQVDRTPYHVVVSDDWGVDGQVLHYLNSRIIQMT
jgi:FAD/FMN-containing dehydrogenase